MRPARTGKKPIALTLTEYRCLRCNRTFRGKAKKPLQCPKCKSPSWQRPRLAYPLPFNEGKKKSDS